MHGYDVCLLHTSNDIIRLIAQEENDSPPSSPDKPSVALLEGDTACSAGTPTYMYHIEYFNL